MTTGVLFKLLLLGLLQEPVVSYLLEILLLLLVYILACQLFTCSFKAHFHPHTTQFSTARLEALTLN